MAVGCFASHGVLVPICGSFRNSSCKTQMLKSNQAPVRRSSSLKVKSYHQNKVFEDCCRGIICYRDESGEIVCEGYDEGPRIHETSYHHRDAEIMSLIQQNWLKNVDGGEIHSANKDFFNWIEDFNLNGFN